MNNAIGVFRICQKFARITDTLVGREEKVCARKKKREQQKTRLDERGENESDIVSKKREK